MRNLTATLCLTIAVLLGSAGVTWSANFQNVVISSKVPGGVITQWMTQQLL
jgi:hypothetical protein